MILPVPGHSRWAVRGWMIWLVIKRVGTLYNQEVITHIVQEILNS